MTGRVRTLWHIGVLLRSDSAFRLRLKLAYVARTSARIHEFHGKLGRRQLLVRGLRNATLMNARDQFLGDVVRRDR